MKQKDNRGGARENAGRKPTLPEGARIRGIRMSDDEFVKVKLFLKMLREDFKKEQK